MIISKLFFMTDAITLSTGETVYISVEKIEDAALRYWRWYLDSAESFSKEVLTPFVEHSRFALAGQHPFWVEQQNKYFEEIFTKPRCEAMKQYIASNINRFTDSNFKQLKSGLNDGFFGFHYALQPQLNQQKERFVVYITRTPLKSPISTDLSSMPLQFNQPYGFTCYAMQHNAQQMGSDFQARYHNLLMSMAVVTNPSSVSVTHMGIFKNPQLFISPENKCYPNLAILLQSFSAHIFLSQFGKTLQINQPTQCMRKILRLALPDGSIREEESCSLAENHCPVQEGGVTTIGLPELASLFLQRPSVAGLSFQPCC